MVKIIMVTCKRCAGAGRLIVEKKEVGVSLATNEPVESGKQIITGAYVCPECEGMGKVQRVVRDE